MHFWLHNSGWFAPDFVLCLSVWQEEFSIELFGIAEIIRYLYISSLVFFYSDCKNVIIDR